MPAVRAHMVFAALERPRRGDRRHPIRRRGRAVLRPADRGLAHVRARGGDRRQDCQLGLRRRRRRDRRGRGAAGGAGPGCRSRARSPVVVALPEAEPSPVDLRGRTPSPPPWPRPKPAKSQAAPAKASSAARTVRVDAERLDALMHSMGELVIHRTAVEALTANLDVPGLQQAMQELTRSSQALQAMVMQVRMIPVDVVFLRFPRLVRDLSRQAGQGGQAEPGRLRDRARPHGRRCPGRPARAPRPQLPGPRPGARRRARRRRQAGGRHAGDRRAPRRRQRRHRGPRRRPRHRSRGHRAQGAASAG